MKAILIVDIQNGLTHKKSLYNELNFIETVNNAIQKYRELGYVLIFIQHNNKQLISRTKNWEIDSRLTKEKDDIFVQKQHGNAFDKTDLKSILISNKVQEILICGLVSHGCVMATCRGGLETGFITNLLKNGHTNWNKDAELKISTTELELNKLGINIVTITDL